jgi:hypothetical protein
MTARTICASAEFRCVRPGRQVRFASARELSMSSVVDMQRRVRGPLLRDVRCSGAVEPRAYSGTHDA